VGKEEEKKTERGRNWSKKNATTFDDVTTMESLFQETNEV
jgi:hypothetical protein